MNTKFKVAIAALAIAGVGTAAIAHNHKGHGHGDRAERMFERMDTDKDGRVTTEDAKAFAAARFASVDTNADGEITRDERRAARKAMRSERRAEFFSRMDADGDGMISQADMQAAAGDRAARRFARLDKDGDGFVSVAEIEQMRGERGEGRRGKHDGKRKGDRAEGGKRGPATLEKMQERVLKRFARLDKDGDGVITIEDIRNR